MFDLIIIGAGHAGIEATNAACKKNLKVALISFSKEDLGKLSCNPSIGGIGKSHLVHEIEALGGVIGKAADFSSIHKRILNQSKGIAVQALRVQTDRNLYQKYIKSHLNALENVTFIEDEVVDLIIKQDQIKGVVCKLNAELKTKACILTSGTFLGANIFIGKDKQKAGRLGSKSASLLAKNLAKYNLKTAKLKTGTPARLAKKSIDFSCLEEQTSLKTKRSFSKNQSKQNQIVSCYLGKTNLKTHEIIKENINLSAMYSGNISGKGPRYCPSIEDKISRFLDKDSHQIFFEPETQTQDVIYPSGISTSLPKDIQEKFLRSIKGLENVDILEFGYAVEYEYFDPSEIFKTLMSKKIQGLFLAGQINGTTGYEEAAALGLVAGVNAANYILKKDPFELLRQESYIGVMLDDLMTQGIIEPYRMFTCRAEYRLYLREDNADLRLSEKAKKEDLITQNEFFQIKQKYKEIQEIKKSLKNYKLTNDEMSLINKKKILKKDLMFSTDLASLLKREDFSLKDLKKLDLVKINLSKSQKLSLEAQIKYSGYLKRQLLEIEKQKEHEFKKLPQNFDYNLINGLSNEVITRLNQYQPQTIAMASRIFGITPSAISILLVFFKKNKKYL